MKTSIKNTAFAIATAAATVVVSFISGDAQAQQPLFQNQPQPNVQATQQFYIPPVAPPVTPPVTPPTTQEYYFGFSVQLMRGFSGTILQIVSVTPGSPAQMAGLEVGDEILTVNGRGFNFARDSFDAVRLMNRYVARNAGGGGPAPAAATAATAYYVGPPMQQAVASMIVRNVRNGQNVSVTVRPTPKGFGGPAPAAAAATR